MQLCMCKLGVIFQEQLKIQVKLLLSVNMKSYMPRRLAQQRMTLIDLEWPFHGSYTLNAAPSTSRAISAILSFWLLLLKLLHRLSLLLSRLHMYRKLPLLHV